jgi:hypothetical protein
VVKAETVAYLRDHTVLSFPSEFNILEECDELVASEAIVLMCSQEHR